MQSENGGIGPKMMDSLLSNRMPGIWHPSQQARQGRALVIPAAAKIQATR